MQNEIDDQKLKAVKMLRQCMLSILLTRLTIVVNIHAFIWVSSVELFPPLLFTNRNGTRVENILTVLSGMELLK